VNITQRFIQAVPLQHHVDEDCQSDMYRCTIQKAAALSTELYNHTLLERCYSWHLFPQSCNQPTNS